MSKPNIVLPVADVELLVRYARDGLDLQAEEICNCCVAKIEAALRRTVRKLENR